MDLNLENLKCQLGSVKAFKGLLTVLAIHTNTVLSIGVRSLDRFVKVHELALYR